MNKGFTLIELVITIALVVLLSTIGMLSLVNFRVNQSLRLASGNLVTFLRDAQQKSISQEGGLQWGARFTHQAAGDRYELISGTSTFDPAGTVVSLPSNLEFASAYGDVTFNKFGLPASPTTLILRVKSDTSLLRTITINAQGIIQEQ